MDEVWPWLSNLPEVSDWQSTTPPPTLSIATSSDKSILLRAERTAGADTDVLITLSIVLHGFHHPSANPSKTLWLSNPLPLSNLLHPLLLQLLQEVASHVPSPPSCTLPPEAVSTALSAGTANSLLSLTFHARIFWLCATVAPPEAGFLFFSTAASIDPLSIAGDGGGAGLSSLLVAAGSDWEHRLTRSLGYMIAKWCLLRHIKEGNASAAIAAYITNTTILSYAANSHGLFIVKAFVPIPAMPIVISATSSPAKDSLLLYALAHQQLEAVVQLDHSVSMLDPRFLKITLRVDNIRLNVVRLGLGDVDVDEMVDGERHFPSRVRVWVGPAVGSNYATGPSLGKSTVNPERKVETRKSIRGSLGGQSSKGGGGKGLEVVAEWETRTKGRGWRWEQEAEGAVGVVEGVLCDGDTGTEVAAWRPGRGGGGDPRRGMRGRWSGMGRCLSKRWGVVVAGDEVGEEGMSWRVGREMEGSVVKWRVGCRVWMTYFPNEVKSGYFETRCVEWEKEVDLELVGCM